MKKLESYLVIKENRIFNTNTSRFEAIPGDKIKLPIYTDGVKEIKEATVNDITNYQIIPTVEFGVVVVDSKEIDEVEIL